MRYIFGILLFCFSSSPAYTQFYFEQSTEIPVRYFQDELSNAWAGGLNNAQVSSIDLDIDGILDVVVFDKNGNRILPFLYKPSQLPTAYIYAPSYISQLPPLQDWVISYDYNNDGKLDLVSGKEDGIVVYTNISTSGTGLAFSPYSNSPLQTLTDGVTAKLGLLKWDIPALTDVDNDGDMDILAFDTPGAFVEYHQNQSIEQYGHADSLKFFRVEACWGGFKEAVSDNSVQLNVLCKGFSGQTSGGGRHAGSTLLSFDKDNDGDKELVIGDISFGDVILLTNGGSPQFAEMASQTTSFPNSQPIQLPVFPAMFLPDVDNDGDRDLIVSPHAENNVADVFNVWMYENTGSDTLPIFTFRQHDWLQEDMIDVGTSAKPILLDYDQDGLTDLIISNGGAIDEKGTRSSQVYLLRNTGTSSQAEFELITDNLANLLTQNYSSGITPAFGDLDNDGDYDMIVGKADGTLDYYQNFSATPNEIFPIYGISTVEIDGIDVGDHAQPILFDINKDSLLDLVIGEQRGNLNYWKNTGSLQQAAFTYVSDSLGKVKLAQDGSDLGFSSPSIFEYQGETQMLVGAENGNIYRYSGIDSMQTFVLEDANFGKRTFGRRSAAATADLNNDGKADLIAGNFSGGLNLYMGTDSNSVSIQKWIDRADLIQIFPNPTRDGVMLRAEAPFNQLKSLRLYNLNGKMVFHSTDIELPHYLPLSQFPPAIYYLDIQFEHNKHYSQKIWIQK